MTDLNGISSIHLQRLVTNGFSQLLFFCDLSSKAYATDICIYISTIKSDKITVILFFSKARNCTEEETYHSKARTDICTNWYKEPTFCGKNTKFSKDYKILKRYYGQILNVYYSGSRTDRTCPFL